jgi:protein-S-isoprenylcysteine O-methyltransferase Ste14
VNIFFIIFTGIIGFLLLLIFDILMLKKVPGIKFVIWVIGIALIIFTIVEACLSSEKLPFPDWTIVPGWVLFAIAGLLVLYSLFVNIPFKNTYVANEDKNKLVRTGLYALCRHPGTYWVNLFLMSLILVSRSTNQLIIAVIFICTNTALVVIEDKFIFPGIFTDYTEYQKQTPMLFPSKRSINDFKLNFRKKNEYYKPTV